MVAASCDGVAMANAEARQLASSDVTQAILPPESRACRAVPRGAALVVAQPVSGWLRETWAHEDTARGSDFLSDTPLRGVLDLLDPRSLNTRNYLRVSLHGHQWWTDGWPQLSHRRSRLAGRYRVVPLRRRRRQPRAGGARHARGILRHVVATFTHIPLRAGPPASMISRGGPGCSSFRRSGPGRPSLSLRSKACGVVVVVVAWAARDAARAVACATARAGTAGRWARSGSAEGFEPAVGRPPFPPSPPFAPSLTHGGELVIARVPLLARCGGVVCLLA